MAGAINDPELAELLQRALHARGDDAFERLFETQRGRIEILLRTRMPHALQARVDVDDVIQETYLRAYRKFDRIPQATPEVFRRWIVHLALRELKRAYARHMGAARRDVRRELAAPQDAVSASAAARLSTPSRFVARRESVEILVAALHALPPDYREVVLLRDFEGLPSAVIAKRLGRSSAAVDMLYHRAMLQLGDALISRGLTASRF